MKRSARQFLIALTFASLSMPFCAPGQTWTQCITAPSKLWYRVACSSNANMLIAAANPGSIYTSTNFGATWISNNVPSKNWCAVICSADGKRLAAAASSSGAQIWASADSGATWSLTSAPTGSLQNYTSMAASSDGTKLAATGAYAPTRYIYTSADSGSSWAPTSAPNYPWTSIASSSDGSCLVSAAYNWYTIATSSDSGASWIIHTVPTNYWYAVSSSADGSVLAAASLISGTLFISTNAGSAWVSNNAPKVSYYCLASSADGHTLFAGHAAGLYSTSDTGRTWLSNSVPSYLWASIACTPDAKRGVAAVSPAYNTSTLWILSTLPPSLMASASRSNVTLSWPGASTNFQFQQALAIQAPDWKDVTNSVVITDGQNTVAIAKTNTQAFFRLRGL